MTTTDNITSLISFLTLLQKMRRVYRFNQEPLPDRGHYDTSVEHSYLVVMLAWYIMERDNLPLDRHKVMQILLAHDVVETYAGDVHVFDAQYKDGVQKQKDVNEADARDRLRKEFPEFEALHTSMERFEAVESDEEKFAFACDKLIDPINIYMDDGRDWHVTGVTFKQIMEMKDSKIAQSPYVYTYWQELVELLKKDKEKLFGAIS